MRERNRRAREYSRLCRTRRWCRRMWVVAIVLWVMLLVLVAWCLTLPPVQEDVVQSPPTAEIAEPERIACLIPNGRRNAISREDLAAALHTTDRKMRKAVAEAKKQGLMICNDGDGYYQSDELSDLWRQYRRETARAMSILKARKPMREVLKAAGRPV